MKQGGVFLKTVKSVPEHTDSVPSQHKNAVSFNFCKQECFLLF